LHLLQDPFQIFGRAGGLLIGQISSPELCRQLFGAPESSERLLERFEEA